MKRLKITYQVEATVSVGGKQDQAELAKMIEHLAKTLVGQIHDAASIDATFYFSEPQLFQARELTVEELKEKSIWPDEEETEKKTNGEDH